MPQSFSVVYLHTVFSTKHREPTILETWREELFSVVGQIINNIGCQSILVGGVSDHIHILSRLSRVMSTAEFVSRVKTSSSKWIREENKSPTPFYWQEGYATFSVDRFRLEVVRSYIERQQEHHLQEGFQAELRNALRANGEEWDEEYIWE